MAFLPTCSAEGPQRFRRSLLVSTRHREQVSVDEIARHDGDNGCTALKAGASNVSAESPASIDFGTAVVVPRQSSVRTVTFSAGF